MDHHSTDPMLLQAALFLGAAVIVVPLFKRIGLGSVLGYLAAGALIGPHVLGFVGDAESVRHTAEFGVVLLLFVIGLELRPARLWRLRMDIFGLGLAQVVVTGALLAITTWVLSPLGWIAAISIGAALALSSTAFAVQIMRDRGELTRPHGDRAFSILLFQDISIVPLLALVAFLGARPGEDPLDLMAALQGLAAIAAVVLVGIYGLGPVFGVIARTRSDELFTATALLVVVLAALVMQAVGLSMALGAFLAGVFLAESEFRHQLEEDIEPFRGLFLGLFFISVGMSVQWLVVFDNLAMIAVSAVILYVGKAVLLFALTRGTGSNWRDSVRIAALLGQGGEFGFVILGLGGTLGLWEGTIGSIVSAVIVITMIMTPLAVAAADRVTAQPAKNMEDISEFQEAHGSGKVIVAGFGRFGQVVARILKLRGYEVTLIDNDPDRIRIARTFGDEVFFGDLRRADVLKRASAGQARAIFLCGDDRDANAKALEKLRARLPEIPIFCRAADRFELIRLQRLGATEAVRENFESAIDLARLGMAGLGDADISGETIEEFRRRDDMLLRLQTEHGLREGWNKMREQYSLGDEK